MRAIGMYFLRPPSDGLETAGQVVDWIDGRAFVALWDSKADDAPDRLEVFGKPSHYELAWVSDEWRFFPSWADVIYERLEEEAS